MLTRTEHIDWVNGIQYQRSWTRRRKNGYDVHGVAGWKDGPGRLSDSFNSIDGGFKSGQPEECLEANLYSLIIPGHFTRLREVGIQKVNDYKSDKIYDGVWQKDIYLGSLDVKALATESSESILVTRSLWDVPSLPKDQVVGPRRSVNALSWTAESLQDFLTVHRQLEYSMHCAQGQILSGSEAVYPAGVLRGDCGTRIQGEQWQRRACSTWGRE